MSLDDYPLISDWIGLRGDRLCIRTGKVDIGQRISSALAQIASEELTVPLNRIDVATVRTGDSPDEGVTSGSNSIEQSGSAVRLAAATLRRILLVRAAERLGGAPGDWRLSEGELTGPGANRPLALGDLLDEVALAEPVDPAAELMPPTRKPPRAKMRGISEMVTGRYRFLHDMEVEGMVHARMVRAPHALARLRTVDQSAVTSVEKNGIHVVLDGSFIAVAGRDEWPVMKAAARIARACEWDGGDGLPEGDVFDLLSTDRATRLVVRDGTPYAEEIPSGLSAPGHAARYERPFTMHGSLAPSAAFAVWQDGRLEITTHSQGIYPLRQTIAESLGLPLDAVVLTHAPGSGCYGHNGADDAAYEAALIARALPATPILLKWSREDEHQWEPYGPAQAVELAAATDGDGRISAFSAEAISGTYRGRPRPGPNRAGSARLIANWFRADAIDPQPPQPNLNRQGGMQRNLDPIYDVGETRYVKNLVADLPLRTSALRCLGAVANVFAIESFMDELALHHGRDPLEYRLAHLRDPRGRAVLDRLREAAGTPPAADGFTGRGIAYGQYKNAMTRVGISVDLVVGEMADIRLSRVLIVADAGRIIDSDGLEAQLEGGFLQGASWALHEQVTWDRDGVISADWDRYPVLRFDNIPRIEVILLNQPNCPSLGAGEASPGPAVAAIANAVHAATGLRLRRLPFTPDALTTAAMNQ